MAYEKTDWSDFTEPFIDAENLNKIESGIETADENANAALDALNGYSISMENGRIVLTK